MKKFVPACALALGVSLWSAFVAPAQADDFLYAFKFGVLAHDVPDLWSGFSVEDRWVDINFEAQFKPALMVFGGAIRPVVGASINTNGDTSHLYADARWQIDCDRLFFGIGLGAAIHDGETGPPDPNAKWLGSRVLFHIPAEVGIHLDEHNDLSVYFEHTSNAYTMEYNEGLDRIGIRYGYRF
ncbi:MAG: acyloxyacyl hydrolase [Hyphomicrobium sp.]